MGTSRSHVTAQWGSSLGRVSVRTVTAEADQGLIKYVFMSFVYIVAINFLADILDWVHSSLYVTWRFP